VKKEFKKVREELNLKLLLLYYPDKVHSISSKSKAREFIFSCPQYFFNQTAVLNPLSFYPDSLFPQIIPQSLHISAFQIVPQLLQGRNKRGIKSSKIKNSVSV